MNDIVPFDYPRLSNDIRQIARQTGTIRQAVELATYRATDERS